MKMYESCPGISKQLLTTINYFLARNRLCNSCSVIKINVIPSIPAMIYKITELAEENMSEILCIIPDIPDKE
jgi:hypothetical protein